MGYTKRAGTEITDFWPDDTDTKMYLETSTTRTIRELMDLISTKWPGAEDLKDIEVETEHIHTSCLYYDRYDGSDYTNFLVLTYNKE